ncbi:MAG: SGNH/GDSL hydrolase family protein [Rhodobacterales bacterium]|nr:SGNH/GDSL hydrolase family protein [Rhodobacterales bacterium]
MNWFKGTAIGAVGLLAAILVSGPVHATPSGISQIFAFGDSLSDPTNVKNAVGCPPGPCNPVTGRFSDGTNWVDKLGGIFGVNPTAVTEVTGPADVAQGVNFAFGGAGSGSDNGGLPILPGLQQQIGMFDTVTGSGALVAPDALFTLWIGANDYLLLGETNPANVINNIVNTISALYALGAQDFMVLNLPDLGALPLVAGDPVAQAGLTALSAAHNAALAAALPALFGTLPGANLVTVDIDAIYDDIIGNPLANGFTNTTDPCLDLGETPPVVCTTPESYLFWDDQHPTTATYNRIGQIAANALVDAGLAVPAPAGAALLMLGLAVVARRRRG